MTNRLLGVLLAFALACAGAAVRGEERGSPDDARAMAIRAAELFRTAGPEAALAQFNAPQGPFRDRDLYVFVLDNTGLQIANGANPNLVGRNIRDLRDVQGKLLVQEMLAVQTEGWIDYRWLNPQTRAVEAKSSYVVRVGDYLVGVGAYRP